MRAVVSRALQRVDFSPEVAVVMRAFVGFISVLGVCFATQAEDPVKYNREIQPILANHCFACHGPDRQSRKGGLRLDQRDAALAQADSGAIAVVPQQPEASELWLRIQSSDPDVMMPPPDVKKPLTEHQKNLLKRWIAEGAEYQPHWAFLPIVRPAVPTVQRADWVRNEIDAFILSRLETEGLSPSAEADSRPLFRRLSLDLTGLPPSPETVDQFVREMETSVSDQNSDVSARLVNQLLDSPHYGERMAVDWLDAARYADTNGYQVDRDREMYAWRDWVIQAFNSNMPFDQFTVEQIAGDLLPEATLSQKIATGFHRNHMLNEEGGIIDAEFLAEYCADRVETTAAVWLGQTFTCARCHDHKYDPFTQQDYYGLYAFYHNVTEKGVGNYGAHYRRSAPPFLALPAPELEQKLNELRPLQAEAQKALSELDEKLRTEQPAWEAQLLLQLDDPSDAAKEANAKIPAEVIAILKKPIADRTDAEAKKLASHHQSTHSERKPLADKEAELTKQVKDAESSIPTTLVMEELPQPRETRILMRGVYSRPGDVVTAGTPASLPEMNSDWPRNRLGLAKWLIDPQNPLPARVTVNRLWQMMFGTGLVRTAEDFGTQGAPPSHPELLDWLADEYVRSGWDTKHMLRLIVTSATYRQSSVVSAELKERDPENRLLARGPRFRLQAEFVRDQALCASGLLVSKVGGPSVKPYHPPGLYEQVTAGNGTNVYVEDQGENLYRRSLYTYWKRSVPHPAMLVFDAPFREACALRRPRTNTPLQALNLMNDPAYVEASRFLAGRMLTDGGSDVESQISHGFRLVLARSPEPRELSILRESHQRALDDFSGDTSAAKELLNVGATRSPEQLPPVPLAAMTVVASTILNLDEAVMRE